jgi:hypothetical protein
MARLMDAVRRAQTADLQRAAQFLERAREIRAGSTRQRTASRKAQAEAWVKKTDAPYRWE